MHLPIDQILLGDCLDVLRTLPDASVDSVVCDPPYGLGNKDPSPENIFMYVLGASVLDTGGDFMGSGWSIPPVPVWREVYRVLKPGGHVLSFAGSRTADLIGIGLRMAGFESRDSIARMFPTLYWTYGSGMPKSHSIGPAIDKKLGPESKEAAQWEGWGSGIKPAAEPILVFRKPLEGTLANNVLKYGTGGLNIDATRVRHASKDDFEAHKKGVDAIREKGGSRDKSWKNASDLSGANEVTTSGRWPANLLLEHVPYAEWWRLRADISELQRQETFAYYGVEQTLSAMRGAHLGDPLDSGKAEVLLKSVRGAFTTGPSATEDGLGVAAMPAMPRAIRSATGLGSARSEEVLLEEVPRAVERRQTVQAGQTSHARSSREDEGRCDGEVPPREFEPVEGRTLYIRAGVRLCHGGSSARAAEGSGSTDGPESEEQDVHPGAPRGGGGNLGSTNPKRRGRASRKRRKDGQSSREPGGGLPQGSQPGPPRDREQGGSARSPVGAATGGELGLEVRGDLVAEHLSPLFTFSRVEGCRKVGTKEIAPHPQGPDRFQKTSGGGFSEAYGNQIAADDPEVLPVWDCADGCPVAALDAQSGDRPSTLTGRADPNGSHEHPGTEMNPNSTFLGERTHLSRVYADAGGASRFFTQLDGAAWECAEGCPVKELQEQGVAMGSHAAGNKGETNHVSGKGYGGAFKPMTNNPDYHADEGGVDRFFSQFEAEGEVPFKYIAKANRKEAGCGEFEVEHVTLKPLALMRWLVRLVTRKGGVVLDPYAGSGSTCHAAVLEGMHFIGIERDEKSHAEATKRLEIVLRRDQERKDEEETYAFMMGRAGG